jgi:23S rRNA-/tRNA-specific pseudouridylate synthase
MLHAWRLRLEHPRTGKEMSFEAPPPADFNDFWSSLE